MLWLEWHSARTHGHKIARNVRVRCNFFLFLEIISGISVTNEMPTRLRIFVIHLNVKLRERKMCENILVKEVLV